MTITLSVSRSRQGVSYSIMGPVESLKKHDLRELFEYAENLIEGIISAEDADIEVLDEIADAELDRPRGEFLRHFLLAWLYADGENKRLLKPAFKQLVRKYRLRVL